MSQFENVKSTNRWVTLFQYGSHVPAMYLVPYMHKYSPGCPGAVTPPVSFAAKLLHI